MSTQWHPLFARMLRLLIEDYYEVQTEVPVSDLPRKGDILVVRRQAGPAPPFRGLWSHLTEWNVLEFKGPTDSPEEDDLELLAHVGTGITYRLNEERRARGEPALANRQVSFWYLASALGETFLGHARGRMALDYQTDGLWRGGVWGHPVWLLSYRDAPVEVDTIPLHLLDREPSAPRSLGELVMQQQELVRRFATWLYTLQPSLWKEVRHMAGTASGIFDWKAIVENSTPAELVQLIRALHVERFFDAVEWANLIEAVGLSKVIEAMGLPKVIDAVGLPKVIETVGLSKVIDAVGLSKVIETAGLSRVIDATGPEKVLDELLTHITAEQLQELLRRRQEKGEA